MQTFMPTGNYEYNASVLDNKRLFKQISECKQIINVCCLKNKGFTHYPKGHKKQGKKIGYLNHPIINLWSKHLLSLKYYQFCMIKEWCMRRWNIKISSPEFKHNTAKHPTWTFNKKINLRHQLSLIEKNPKHYCQFFHVHIKLSHVDTVKHKSLNTLLVS